MELLRVQNLSFGYKSGSSTNRILDNVSFTIQRGEFVGIQGRSGSGKSTLFYVLGCMLRPDQGHVYLEGTDLTKLAPDEMAYVRNRNIGFIFQQFHLLPKATVLDNILLPTLYPCEVAQASEDQKAKALALAERVGLSHRLDQHPNQLSGGEQQRVAIARALMSDSQLILADEPTGNLDSKNSENIMALLKELNASGKTIVLITHDPEIAKHCSKVLHVVDGKFVEQGVSEAAPPQTAAISLKPLRSGMLGTAKYLKLLRTVMPLALENLYRNKVRALLTMVGVTVGIAAVFAMVTFGQFAKSKILKGYEDLGANSLVMRVYPNEKRKATDQVDVVFRSLSWDKDIMPLKRIFRELKYLSPMLASWGTTANFGGLSVQNEVTVMGVTAEYLAIANRRLTAGRPMTPYHVDNREPVCLIGADVATKLFRQGPPIGQMLFLTRSEGLAYPCRIIGVLAPQNSSRDWRKPNLEVLMPYTYFQSVNSFWETEIFEFAVQLKSGSDAERMGKGLKAYFQQKYGLAVDVNVDSDSILLAQMKKFLALFAIMLTAIAAITLSVGGMGINNMMLVSIAERLKEIGLRKAVGATDRSIRVQFLLESTFLSVVAGLLGVALGFSAYEAIIYIASKFVTKLNFEWVLEPSALILSLVSIVVVGIASGIVPALKAERLNVIEALRTE